MSEEIVSDALEELKLNSVDILQTDIEDVGLCPVPEAMVVLKIVGDNKSPDEETEVDRHRGKGLYCFSRGWLLFDRDT